MVGGVGGGVKRQGCKVQGCDDAKFEATRLQGYKATRLWVAKFKASRPWALDDTRLQRCEASTFTAARLRGGETVIRASFGTASASNQNKLFTLGPEDPDSILIWDICHNTHKKQSVCCCCETGLIVFLWESLNSLKNDDNGVPYLCYRILMMKKNMDASKSAWKWQWYLSVHVQRCSRNEL